MVGMFIGRYWSSQESTNISEVNSLHKRKLQGVLFVEKNPKEKSKTIGDLSPPTKEVPKGMKNDTNSTFVQEDVSVQKRMIASKPNPAATPIIESIIGGKVTQLNGGFNVANMSIENYMALYPDSKLGETTPPGSVILDVTSVYSDEAEIDFSQLTGNCPALRALTFMVALRINGNDGYVIQATSIGASSAPIPADVYKCSFSGGPPSNYITVFQP